MDTSAVETDISNVDIDNDNSLLTTEDEEVEAKP